MAIVLALLAPAAEGQGFRCPSSGLGSRLSTIDASASTGQPLLTGLAVLNGELFTSGSSTPGSAEVYVLDFQGNLLRQFSSAPTALPYRDGASDGVGTLIWSQRDGIDFMDVNGNPVTTVVAANGPQTVGVNPLTGSWVTGLGSVSGVAYDPSGNGGDGSLLVGSGSASIAEVDLEGNLLRIYGNFQFWDLSALALSPDGDIIVSQSGIDGPILTIDRQSGFPTGVVADLDRRETRGQGCEVISSPNGPQTLFVSLNTFFGSPNEVVFYQYERFALAPGFDDSGISLEQRIDNAPFGRDRVNVLPTTTNLDFLVSSPTPAAGLLFLNFGPDADVCADNTGLGSSFEALSDLFAATSFSSPVGTPLEFPLTSNTPFRIPGALFLSLTGRSDFRAQAVVAVSGVPSPYLPVVPTSEVRFSAFPGIVGVTVAADGERAFNSDTTRGFWSVTNSSRDPNKAITSVVFDWFDPVNNPGPFPRAFSTATTGMADRFDGGNSTVTNCAGTYRNGSDLATGLIYDALNTVPGFPCDPMANTGWIGTNFEPGRSNEFQTLEWRFAGGTFLSGARFEFDADVAFGPGRGQDQAGMNVTVTFADGTVATGELGAIPGTNRSEVLF